MNDHFFALSDKLQLKIKILDRQTSARRLRALVVAYTDARLDFIYFEF